MDYGPVPSSRFPEVIVHLRNNFFYDEPLNNSVELCRRGEPHAELERLCLDTLNEGISVLAVDPAAGQIAGVALNGILRKGDIQKAQEKLKTVPDKKFRQIFELLYNIHNNIDFFAKYNVDEIFEFRIVSVDGNYRGAGIAKQLVLRSELLAEECGCKIIKVDATSFYTQKVFKEMGFSAVVEDKLSDHKDENGRPIFPTKPPHEFFKIMIKKVGSAAK